MSRILIISPGSPCRNPRPLKEADTLARAGHEVTLLTASESPALDREEDVLLRAAPFRHDRVAGQGGVTDFARKVAVRVARGATEAGRPTLLALGARGHLLRRARSLPADLTIVHNEIPHWIGRDLLAAGRKVAVDFEDWHSEDLLPADRRGRPLGPMRELERTLLQRAAYVSTTSQALADALAARYAAPTPVVITNSFPLQPDPRRPGNRPPAIFWFSQTIGPGRGLEEFCAAWTRTLAPSRLVLLGQPRPGYVEHLRRQLHPTHQSRFEVRDLVAPGALPAVVAAHDLGLALEQSAIANRDLTITNKILQYLNAGLAVLATPTAGQREVLARAPGAGLALDLGDVVAAARVIDTLLADRDRINAMGAAARAAAEQVYSWEREAPRLVDVVARALSARP